MQVNAISRPENYSIIVLLIVVIYLQLTAASNLFFFSCVSDPRRDTQVWVHVMSTPINEHDPVS